jgi:hypothetical protein
MSRRCIRAFVFLCVITIFTAHNLFALPGYAGNDSLWNKAVEITAVNRGWVPGETKAIIELLDSKGKVKKTMEMSITSTLAEDNTIKREISGAEEFRSQMQKQKESQRPGTALNEEGPMFLNQRDKYNPFFPEIQKDLGLLRLENSVMFGGVECVVYEAEVYAEESYTSTIWLNGETGVPVRLQVIPGVLPDGVHSMKVDMVFTLTEDNYLHAKAAVYEWSITKWLIFKLRFRWTMQFDNYFRIPEEQ